MNIANNFCIETLKRWGTRDCRIKKVFDFVDESDYYDYLTNTFRRKEEIIKNKYGIDQILARDFSFIYSKRI